MYVEQVRQTAGTPVWPRPQPAIRSQQDVQETLRDMTDGHGPDYCIDAVGMEAHGAAPDALDDCIKTAVMLETDRSHALRAAIFACAKSRTVSIPGGYGGFPDQFPLGGAIAKGLTLKMGQTNVHRYLPRLLDSGAGRKVIPLMA